MIKKVTLLTIISLCALGAFAQKNYYIEPKLNVAAAAVAIFNPGLEIGFGRNSAINIDYLGSYAKRNYMGTGDPMLLTMVTAEYRSYFLNSEHKGLFAGANIGLSSYKMNKNLIPFVSHNKIDGQYDWGTAVFLGATVGYKFLFKQRLGLEIYVTGGWQESQHELYTREGVLLFPMNASSEWTIYKGGINLSYRLY